MSEDFPTKNRPDGDSLYIIEEEEPFFALGREKLWLSVEGEFPELTFDAETLIKILLLNGHDLPDHCLALTGSKVSKLVLTFGRHDVGALGVSYEIGFFDGEMFRGLAGYRLYPDPTHWVPLPKPPRISNYLI